MTTTEDVVVNFAKALVLLLDEVDRLYHENNHLKGKLADNRPKLTETDVTSIRWLAFTGTTHREIAEIYHVTPATVTRIVNGEYHK